MTEKYGSVYILGSKSSVLYVGVTSNLPRRIYEHKSNLIKGFTLRYNVHILLYYEVCDSILSAIEREKNIKKWRRSKKIRLIKSINPGFEDLYDEISP